MHKSTGLLVGVLLVISGIAVATVGSWLTVWAHVRYSSPSVVVTGDSSGKLLQIEGPVTQIVIYGKPVSVAGKEYFPRVEVPAQTLPVRFEYDGKVEVLGAGGTVIVREYLPFLGRATVMAFASVVGALLVIWGLYTIRRAQHRVIKRR